MNTLKDIFEAQAVEIEVRFTSVLRDAIVEQTALCLAAQKAEP